MQPVMFNITTDASGDYDSSDTTLPQADLDSWATGPMLLFAVRFVDTDLDNTADITLSMTNTLGGVDTTLLTLTNANGSQWFYPRVNAHDAAGAAWAEGADKTASRSEQVVEGTLKVVVAQGGNVKTGKLIAYLAEI